MRPQPETQSAFLGVVHVAVEDEGIDARLGGNLMPRVTVGRCLHGLAIRAVRRVEALLTQDHAAIASLKLQRGLAEESTEGRQVPEGNPRGGFPIGLGTGIPPGARVEEVFRVGVVSEVPVVIAARTGLLGERFEERPSWEDLSLLPAGVGDVPMMFEGEEHTPVLGMLADGLMGQSDGAFIVDGKRIGGAESEVGPEPVRIDLVAHDPVPDPAVTAVGPVPPFGQKLDGGLVPSPSLGRHRVEGR